MSSLFLGMAHTDYNKKLFRKKKNRIFGQVFRDRIRLKMFKKTFGMCCYTIDNKHDDIINKHIYANFNHPRRLKIQFLQTIQFLSGYS